MSRGLVLLLIGSLALVLAPPAALASPSGGPAGEAPAAGPDFRPGAVLVKFKPKVRQWDREEVLGDVEGREEARTRSTAVRRVAVQPGQEQDKLRQLRADPRVQYAELDHAVSIAWTPTDPSYSAQWGLPKIDAPEAWDTARGSGVTVAVIDTGADLAHPDLQANLVAGYNFAGDVDNCPPSDGTPNDDNGHGTHVSGIVAAIANNGIGVVGVAPRAKVMPLKALDCKGIGYYSDVILAIGYAADNGVQVINMSLAGSADDPLLEREVNEAWDKGVLLVGAAGNSNRSTPPYPAGYSNVMAVAATTTYDAKASYSNYGSWVSVAAPGGGMYLSEGPWIFSTYPGDRYRYMSGTSMAAPMVAGVAAVVWSSACTSISNASVRRLIEDNADNIDSALGSYAGKLGYGRVNVARALPVSETIDVSTDSLLYIARAGDTQTQQRTVDVSTGSCQAAWRPAVQSLSPDTGWLEVAASGSPADSIVVTADPSTLTSGHYTATVALMPPSGSDPLRTIGVQMIVAPQVYQASLTEMSK